MLIHALQSLSEDLSSMDFIKILDLFKGSKKFRYLSEIQSCVHLSNFVVDNVTVHATYLHQSPRMKNFTLFSCEALHIENQFYINDLHNRFLSPQDIIKYNRTRKVISSDFVLENLKVIVKKDVKANGSGCFHIFFFGNCNLL